MNQCFVIKNKADLAAQIETFTFETSNTEAKLHLQRGDIITSSRCYDSPNVIFYQRTGGSFLRQQINDLLKRNVPFVTQANGHTLKWQITTH